MNIITNLNPLFRRDLSRPDGTIDFDRLRLIQSDGIWSVAMGTGDLTEDELIEVYTRLGPGYVVAEDGCFQTDNYRTLRRLLTRVGGRVADYMSYYEDWFAPLPYSVPNEVTTCLSLYRVDWVLNDLRLHKINDVSAIAVSTRNFNEECPRCHIKAALNDVRVSAVTIEMHPNAANFEAWFLNDLVRMTLDAGKKCYLLLPPKQSDPHFDYVPEMSRFVDAVRRTNRLWDHRLYFVPSIYGSASTTWFGPNNSIEAAITFLKRQSEYHSQYPITEVEVSTELPGWPKSNLLDGRSQTCWSNYPSQDREPAITFRWGSRQPVNYIGLRPRWDSANRRTLCFPVDFAIYQSDGSQYHLVGQVANYPVPTRDEWVFFSVDTVTTHEIRVVVSRMGVDDHGGAYFQLGDIAVGHSRNMLYSNAKLGANRYSA